MQYTEFVRTRTATTLASVRRPLRPAAKLRPSSLAKPVTVSEDDADGIISMQRLKMKEQRYSLDRVLRENGIKLER
jgi:hypothetical protein